MRLTLTATVLLLAAASGEAAVVGLDARSLSAQTGWNPAFDARYATFRSAFTGAGHTLTPLTSFKSVDLAPVELLVLFHPADTVYTYSAEEIMAVQTHVASGRPLFVVGDGGWSTSSTVGSLNSILQPSGIALGTQVLNGSGAVFTGFLPHPVTQGVTSIGLDYHRLLTITGPATDLASGSSDIIAVSDSGGGGRVAVIGDASCFTDAGFGADYDITSLDNRKFLDNAISWLIVPFGDGCPGAGGFVPVLTATSYLPAAGSQIGIQLSNGLGGAPTTFFFGAGQASLPMAGTCTLNIAPLFPLSFTVPLSGAGAGNGSVFFAGILPLDSSGFTFAMQAFVSDPTFSHGFSNSNEIVVAVQ